MYTLLDFPYTSPIHRSPVDNFTFSFIIPTDNTFVLLSISKPTRSFPLLFLVIQVFLILLSVPFSSPFYVPRPSPFTSKIYQFNFITFPFLIPHSSKSRTISALSSR